MSLAAQAVRGYQWREPVEAEPVRLPGWKEFGPFYKVVDFTFFPLVAIHPRVIEIGEARGELEKIGYDMATDTYTYRWTGDG